MFFRLPHPDLIPIMLFLFQSICCHFRQYKCYNDSFSFLLLYIVSIRRHQMMISLLVCQSKFYHNHQLLRSLLYCVVIRNCPEYKLFSFRLIGVIVLFWFQSILHCFCLLLYSIHDCLVGGSFCYCILLMYYYE